jgi:hypothetical protein
MKKIKAAQKQLDRALANLDRAANCLEEAGLTPHHAIPQRTLRPHPRYALVRSQVCERLKPFPAFSKSFPC